VLSEKEAIMDGNSHRKIPQSTTSAEKTIVLPERSGHGELTDLYCSIESGRVENI
jgi:hypothetical protein